MSTPRRDPSFVDRQRLDSDVRAFLRQPSTPWMVFDRDDGNPSPPPGSVVEAQAPFVGAVLEGSGSSVIDGPNFFPTHDAYAPEPPPSESSTAAVVSEIVDGPAHRPPQHAIDFDAQPFEASTRRGRWAAIAGIGAVALVGAALTIGLFAPGVTVQPQRSAAAAGMKSLPVDLPSTDLDSKPSPVAEKAPEPAATTPVAPKSTSKFGKLTITGTARSHQVFMDGKRFLGTGTRSFTVMCGSHAIGIDSRTDTTDREVPCGGELVITD